MSRTSTDHDRLWRHLRLPALSFVALLVLLGAEVFLGATHPFAGAGYAEAALAALMVACVLLMSMEITREPPLIRLFSVLGFFWVLILFSMTLVDYLSR